MGLLKIAEKLGNVSQACSINYREKALFRTPEAKALLQHANSTINLFYARVLAFLFPSKHPRVHR